MFPRVPKRVNARLQSLPRQPIDSPQVSQPFPHITNAFRAYIHNDIPARLIDTSTLTFVERNAIFDVFSSEIARITDEDILRRMRASGVDTHSHVGIYVNPHKAALKETIRDIVRYAIFSHRWTDSEPSYQDVVPSGGLSRKQRKSKTAGFAKLVQFCEKAKALGYKFVWSDTCCIDKTNAIELSEAIHAMFKWYAHAHLCIIHLAGSSSLLDFELEEWFRRGWTLQELLAPKRIKFYSRDWRPFTVLSNDKDDPKIMGVLSAVTGIPRDVVVADNSGGIRGHDVWEIMSWASKRRTTRVEDAAYCLLGLFDINLSITYGEGEKAFPRLIEALVARRRTWEVFAWGGQASSSHPLLPWSPACYPKWDEEVVRGGVGMTAFELTLHGLRLESVPLIPMAYASTTEGGKGSHEVTLRPRPEAAVALGTYSNVTVVCGPGQLQHLRDATDLHACILNYKPRRQSHGKLQIGRTYICFLLHREVRSAAGESTWLKFATDNVLRIVCKDAPAAQTSPEGVPDIEKGTFTLELSTTHIRVPWALRLSDDTLYDDLPYSTPALQAPAANTTKEAKFRYGYMVSYRTE